MGVVESLPSERPRYTAPRLIALDDRLDGFDCGKEPLNDFLKSRALDNEGKASRTYVICAAAGEDAGAVIAYYSLAAGAVARSDLAGPLRRNMPNPVPVMVLGRMAVDSRHAGKGLGKAMLKEAIQRVTEAANVVGARAMVVHAIDDEAVAFYTQFGFQVFPAASRTLFLPIQTIVGAL